ncbi:TPA: helix-turn-helix transcriptional regulator [Citrobacter braakii]
MINVLIETTNQFFKQGLQAIVRDLFMDDYNEEVVFYSDLSPENVWNANLIFISFVKGENHTCKQELKLRNKGCLFGMVNTGLNKHIKSPLCYSGIDFINNKTNPEALREEIVYAWNRKKDASQYPHNYSCRNCNHRKLSCYEKKIASEMIAGSSPKMIAEKFDVPEKKVYAHTYTMRKKFILQNNFELVILLKKMIK